MERINLVYIHSHDVGRYISPFGYKMDTPCLQQLAESGMLFRNMHRDVCSLFGYVWAGKQRI